MKYILELGPQECRWPVRDGEDEPLFCAEHTERGESYCEDHRGLSVAGAPRLRPRSFDTARNWTGAPGERRRTGNVYGTREEGVALAKIRAADRERDLVEIFGADA